MPSLGVTKGGEYIVKIWGCTYEEYDIICVKGFKVCFGSNK
jgi:hypothetical protein